MTKKKPPLLQEERVATKTTTKTTTLLFQFLNPIDSELHRLSTKIEAECFPLLREREIPIIAEDEEEDDNNREDFDGAKKKKDYATADGVVSLYLVLSSLICSVFVSDLSLCVCVCCV
jgi:hypothetical protein